MKKTHYFFSHFSCIVLFLFLSQSSNAQEITDKDSDIVTSKSIEMLQEFKQLLTLLISPDIDEATIKELIANSYAKNDPNAIFFNESVIFEDDINPNHFDYKTASDFALKTYLKNIDLFLTKGNDSSIVFSDIKVSNVKLGEFLYVKVFFKSLFKVNNKEIKIPYRTTERVAEIRAEYENDKWKFYIMRVSFVTPDDLADPYKNDLDIVETAKIGARKMDVSTLLKEKERRRAMEDERKITVLFQKNINSGDSALKVHDYVFAITSYQKAKELQPNEKVAEINQKIKDTEILKEATRIVLEKKKAEDDEAQKAVMALNKKMAELQQQALSEKQLIEKKDDEETDLIKLREKLLLKKLEERRIYNFIEGNGDPIFTEVINNGKQVIGLTNDGKIKILEVSSGQLFKKINLNVNFGSGARLISAAISKDANFIAIANKADIYDRLLIYDMKSEKILSHLLTPNFAQSFEFSEDGKSIVVGYKNKLLQIYNVQSGDIEKEVTFDTNIISFSYAPSGTQIYVTTNKDFQIISAK